MPKLVLASCVALCGLALAAASASAQEAPIQYTLTVGSDREAYEDDTQPRAGGEDIGGQEIIRINGNPVGILTTGAKILAVNQMLKPGENTISLEGRVRRTLYVKIYLIQGDRLLNIVARKAVRPDDAGAEREVKFKTDVAYTPPFYNEPAKVEDTPAARDELWKWVDQFQKDVAAGKAAEAAARIFEGPRTWIVKCYGLAPDALAEMIKQQAEWAASIQKTLQPLAKEDLKFVFGPNAVMVYAGIEAPPQAPTYLFTLKDGDDVQRVPHLIFARVGGKWVVW